MPRMIRFTPEELAVIRLLYGGGYALVRMGMQEWSSLEISRDGKRWDRIPRCLLPHTPRGCVTALAAYAEKKHGI